LLLRAKRVGFIREIKPQILILAESGIWIGKDLIEGVLRAAGEDL
jgi:predicted nucleic acid-binding protein